MEKSNIEKNRRSNQIPFWIVLLVFLGVAVFFLWEEHKAHLLGALPWLIFLLCPLIHIFGHGNHGKGHDKKEHHHGA